MTGRLTWPTALWLATKGGRSDAVRIALTAVGSAAGTVALLGAATVMGIEPGDGPYTMRVLQEEGLHQGVVIALVLLCIPVLAFVGQCFRVGAPARDRRLAAIRLAGGSPADVTRVACGEAGVAAGLGAALGLIVYLAGRIVLGTPITGPYVRITRTTVDGGVTVTQEEGIGQVLRLPTDVLPPVWAIALLVVAVPLGAVVFTRLALRRVTITPFGVSRHRRTRPPRLLPAVMFLAGVAALASFSSVARALDVDTVGLAVPGLIVVTLLLLTSAGLVLGTAALAAGIGGFLAPRVRHPALLIAARRLAADPFAGSRAFGALLLTVLIGAGAQGLRVNILASTDPSTTFYADTLNLVDLVIVVAVVVASLGLLVIAAEGIVARRRSLAALTAAGTPHGVLRRAVLAEALLPLLPTSVLAAAAGVFAARGLFGTTYVQREFSTTGQLLGERITAIPVPWTELVVLVAGTLLITSLATSVSLLFLRGSTSPSELRAAA